MVDDRRDTVIVEKDREGSPIGWIIAVIIIILLVLVFFAYGGFGLFGGSTSNNNGGSGGNVPGTTQVQPSTSTGK